MRKISMDQYEEQYSAELCIKGYTHYKYTKTLREICEWVETLLADYGIKKKMDPVKLSTPEAIEAIIKTLLDKKGIKYTTIEIEFMPEFDETEYDPD